MVRDFPVNLCALAWRSDVRGLVNVVRYKTELRRQLALLKAKVMALRYEIAEVLVQDFVEGGDEEIHQDNTVQS